VQTTIATSTRTSISCHCRSPVNTTHNIWYHYCRCKLVGPHAGFIPQAALQPILFIFRICGALSIQRVVKLVKTPSEQMMTQTPGILMISGSITLFPAQLTAPHTYTMHRSCSRVCAHKASRASPRRHPSPLISSPQTPTSDRINASSHGIPLHRLSRISAVK
jgi:hypothetical protein